METWERGEKRLLGQSIRWIGIFGFGFGFGLFLKKIKCWKALYDTGGKAIEGNRREGPGDFCLYVLYLYIPRRESQREE